MKKLNNNSQTKATPMQIKELIKLKAQAIVAKRKQQPKRSQ